MTNELKIKDSILKTPRDILNLESDDLYDLLNNANDEVIKVEQGIARAEKAFYVAQENQKNYEILSMKPSEMKKQGIIANEAGALFKISPIGAFLLIGGICGMLGSFVVFAEYENLRSIAVVLCVFSIIALIGGYIVARKNQKKYSESYKLCAMQKHD